MGQLTPMMQQYVNTKEESCNLLVYKGINRTAI